ncbi:hypothetical protein FU659_14625 [Paenibacillus sp. N3.4]|nr:SMI1/KNR4 family protein [Paenibacillus sp. N3.4]TXK82566.1 hypothetical protein FU659_14625 [Paenibacillus sp. N3.4]
MANIKWISAKLVNQSVITKLEHDLEIVLPTDYKAIVSECNGGSPIPQTFDIGDKKGFELNALLDITSEPFNELLDAYKVIAERSKKNWCLSLLIRLGIIFVLITQKMAIMKLFF